MATREEELQKKREEAERKARRGEIDPTHDFTIQVGFLILHPLALEKDREGRKWMMRGDYSCRSWPS